MGQVMFRWQDVCGKAAKVSVAAANGGRTGFNLRLSLPAPKTLTYIKTRGKGGVDLCPRFFNQLFARHEQTIRSWPLAVYSLFFHVRHAAFRPARRGCAAVRSEIFTLQRERFRFFIWTKTATRPRAILCLRGLGSRN